MISRIILYYYYRYSQAKDSQIINFFEDSLNLFDFVKKVSPNQLLDILDPALNLEKEDFVKGLATSLRYQQHTLGKLNN